MKRIDLSRWRKVLVSGSDAHDWLNDLISASVTDEPGRSLLLTPTGRIRADFHVVPRDVEVELIQDPIQPKPVDELLAPYVLSSDVSFSDGAAWVAEWRDGSLAPVSVGWTMHEPTGLGLDAFDEWRIHHGIPRFGIDLDEDSLPQEAGWERFIDFTKGCFMGQEAMAKIQNFGGHPTRAVLALRSGQPVTGGEPLFADGEEVGIVTSAAGTDVVVRVRWSARAERLRTAEGSELSDRA